MPAEPKIYCLTHETKFGGVYFDITIEDFNALGFAFGDSVDVAFSNGKTLNDLPYYNGYYVDMGEPLLVGYPGYPYLIVSTTATTFGFWMNWTKLVPPPSPCMKKRNICPFKRRGIFIIPTSRERMNPTRYSAISGW